MSRCGGSFEAVNSMDSTPANMVPEMLLCPTRLSGRKTVDTQPNEATSSTEWVGMKPSAWVELLASIVEQRERACGEKRELEPILQLKNGRLAQHCEEKPSSNELTLVPVPAEEDSRRQEVKSIDERAVKNTCTSYSKCPQNDGRSYSGSITSSDEAIIPDDVTSSAVPSRKLRVAVMRNRSERLQHYYWDLSFLSARDSQNTIWIDEVVVLAGQLDSMPNVVHVSACYRRIRQHFHRTFCWITKQYPSCDNESSTHLRSLYKLTAHKLQALIRMAKLLVLKAEKTNHLHGFPPRRSTPDGGGGGGQWKHLPTHMTTWLRDNWTNPYPDDEGLCEMARECGVGVSVVNNWLINARTRKWRPAIAKAYEMNRPVDLLYQDSMKIFDGLPLSDGSASEMKSSTGSVVPDKVESTKA